MNVTHLWYPKIKTEKTKENMNYELCLEYGTFPLKEIGDYVIDDQNPPSFIADDQVLVNKLTVMN